eukprot:SAG11_NODE_659_length_7895_cov_18.189969_3_plen_50_part_00
MIQTHNATVPPCATLPQLPEGGEGGAKEGGELSLTQCNVPARQRQSLPL